MGFEVDPSFQKGKSRARARQKQKLLKRLLAGGAGFAAVVLVLALVFWPGDEPEIAVAPDVPEETEKTGEETGLDEFTMVQTEGSAEAGVDLAAASFVDLRGDPMILRFETGQQSGPRKIAGAGFDERRVGPDGPERLSVIQDDLLVLQRQLTTTLPSSREDFAYFQARRAEGMAALEEGQGTPALADAGELVQVAGDEGSWGSLIGGDEGRADKAVYIETQIENTTSLAVTLRESQREALFEDIVTVLQSARTLEDVLLDNGFEESAAAPVVQAAERLIGVTGELPLSSVVALRVRPELTGTRLLQLSVYRPEGYVGALAQVGLGRFEPAADPWLEVDLMRRSNQMLETELEPQTDLRLLDALYSAAIRNGLPTREVGELIVMMSQLYDLDQFASEDDQVTIVYATEPGQLGDGPGRILFAGIKGAGGEMPCYVVYDTDSGGYQCFDFNASRTITSGGGGLRSGFIVPVNGTKTSGFGPRHHPILDQLRNHNGVDWAAPSGTPVVAAAAGKISFIGVAGGYGNTVYIDHGQGHETRYAHLSRFDPAMKRGVQVKAGDVIGLVGTTGRSTGPHLHFELRINGKPVDPLGQGGGGTGTGTGAVEALVNQIIKVESAGIATAKNPRSTATGLGQFIQSTWLRMMRDYRPDLVAKLDRNALLALRTDPALSREMVRNLARENEAFLRARGHAITPGRLYLAHFLGPAGAHTALSSDANRSVLEVMGSAVVNANPFLRGKTIADLRNWSDRKMRGAGSAPNPVITQQVAKPVPEAVKAYRKRVDAVLDVL